MKVTFVSNFMSSHQHKFSDKMYELCGGEYYFIACTPVSKGRIKLGFKDENKAEAYIVRAYEGDEQYDFAKKLVQDSDAVIFGSGNEELFNLRMQNKDKATLRYTERLFKEGTFRRFIPMVQKHMYDRFIKYKGYDKFAVLCASAYTANDLRLCGFPENKCYKWGYFPDVKEYDVDCLLSQKRKSSILWVGRFLDWKHPEIPVLIAKRLRADGCKFEMNLIGSGEEEQKIHKMICQNNLEDCVHMLGSKKTDEVRWYMEKAQVFLFTSDRNEGWGAVLNEAMSSGCAVAASHIIGSAPFLIDNGKNGYVYQNGNIDELYYKTKELLDNDSKRNGFGKNAYMTMINEWNAENAAKKLLSLIDDINKGGSGSAENGVCSRAEALKDNWYKSNI